MSVQPPYNAEELCRRMGSDYTGGYLSRVTVLNHVLLERNVFRKIIVAMQGLLKRKISLRPTTGRPFADEMEVYAA
jgi:hypothetical protein